MPPRYPAALAFALGLLLALAPPRAAAQAPTLFTIVDTFGGYDSLARAVEIAGLEEALSAPDSLTLYAPTDAAFAALPAAERAALFADSAALRAVLLYHLRDSARVIPTTPVGLSFAPTLGGPSLQLIRVEAGEEGPEGDSLLVADSVGVEIPDVYAANGIFNAIGQVLTPPDVVDVVAASPVHDTLEAALATAGLADDLAGAGPFTVFAPTDAAFAALPTGALDSLLADPAALADVLGFHVVPGALPADSLADGERLVTLRGDSLAVVVSDEGVVVGGAAVAIPDVTAVNGIVHVVDAVLPPPAPPAVDTTRSVAEVIADSEVHTTLEAALEAAGLTAALDDSTAAFTVFAPVDSAFANLADGALDTLLADPASLADLLRYHVVVGALPADGLADGDRLPTLRGDTLAVAVDGAGVFVDGIAVGAPDLTADNGVVYAVGGVLVPEGFFSGAVEPAAVGGIAVYPTLTRGVVHVGLPRGVRLLGAHAVDLLGRATALAPAGSALDLSGLAPGHYVLLLATDRGRFNARAVRAE